MKALNLEYWKHYKLEFASPTFSSNTTGSLTLENLPGHMAMQPLRALGVAGYGGIVRGSPARSFYDLTAPFGIGQTNLIADGALVTALLKMIYGAQVAPFTGLNLPPYAATGVTAVSKFAADAKSAGWLCSAAETVVQPTFGSLNSTSLIRALNHFASKLSKTTFIKLAAANGATTPPALTQGLAENQSSKWFQKHFHGSVDRSVAVAARF